MPHFPKPYFLSCRGIWKVQIKGKQHNLGPERDDAFRRYHALMGRQVTLPGGLSSAPLIDTLIGAANIARQTPSSGTGGGCRCSARAFLRR